MAGKKIYGEPKRRFTMTLTETAIKWLEEKQAQLSANSLSDVIERMARENLDKRSEGRRKEAFGVMEPTLKSVLAQRDRQVIIEIRT